jgi:hypothetical protein
MILLLHIFGGGRVDGLAFAMCFFNHLKLELANEVGQASYLGYLSFVLLLELHNCAAESNDLCFLSLDLSLHGVL